MLKITNMHDSVKNENGVIALILRTSSSDTSYLSSFKVKESLAVLCYKANMICNREMNGQIDTNTDTIFFSVSEGEKKS